MILLAIGTGILLSFGFGSVFFALLQTSIDYGYTKGIKMASGVLFSDFVMLSLILFGFDLLSDLSTYGSVFKAIAAILLLALGISQFLNFKLSKKVAKGKKSNFLYFFTKGIILNTINPVNFMTWLLLTASLATYEWETRKLVMFYLVCLSTIFLTESVISIYAAKLSRFLNETWLRRLKIATGIIFIAIAFKLFWDAYMG